MKTQRRVASFSPGAAQAEDATPAANANTDEPSLKRPVHPQSSSFAFSYDPETTLAEGYISTHSVAAASSAINDAEQKGRYSREDSRASDYGSSRENSFTKGATPHTAVEHIGQSQSHDNGGVATAPSSTDLGPPKPNSPNLFV